MLWEYHVNSLKSDIKRLTNIKLVLCILNYKNDVLYTQPSIAHLCKKG